MDHAQQCSLRVTRSIRNWEHLRSEWADAHLMQCFHQSQRCNLCSSLVEHPHSRGPIKILQVHQAITHDQQDGMHMEPPVWLLLHMSSSCEGPAKESQGTQAESCASRVCKQLTWCASGAGAAFAKAAKSSCCCCAFCLLRFLPDASGGC